MTVRTALTTTRSASPAGPRRWRRGAGLDLPDAETVLITGRGDRVFDDATARACPVGDEVTEPTPAYSLV